jgi:hypothetical protein
MIHSAFPSELTMWIDPKEVSYRIGENGSICVLYEYKEGVSDPWKPASSSSHKASNNKNATLKQKLTSDLDNATPCKESLRKMDYLLDPRKSVSIEQLAAYVSTS